MHNFNKLVVAGCSVSDRAFVDYNYGDVLAERLGVEFDHQGAGCGSNNRIFRVVTGKIISGEIDSRTLLVIQYTETTRREFWTANWSEEHARNSPLQLRENYRDLGQLIRWKWGSHQWQPNRGDREFFEMIENRHTDRDYETEVFVANHYNFVHQLQANAIPTIFVQAWEYAPFFLLHIPDGMPVVQVNDDNIQLPEDKIAPNDAHFTNSGHTRLAGMLYDVAMNM